MMMKMVAAGGRTDDSVKKNKKRGTSSFESEKSKA